MYSVIKPIIIFIIISVLSINIYADNKKPLKYEEIQTILFDFIKKNNNKYKIVHIGYIIPPQWPESDRDRTCTYVFELNYKSDYYLLFINIYGEISSLIKLY